MAGGIDGLALGTIGAGSLFLWAAVQGKSITGTLQALIKGGSPGSAPAANAITLQTASAGAGFDIATNIPAGSAAYSSSSAVQKLWTDNGGPSNTAAFAAAIAGAESGGSAKVTSSNPDGGTNVGVFQLDTKGVGSGYSVAELQDANLNTQLTIMATGGGVNWQEWGNSVAAAVGYHYTPGSAVP
ncbi:hypothetical protein [Actinospica sp.]|jgi:hypothetical protein|uniref:hypothetical protein n=1 Tax=Actinospica sp. TaxID=1872142 RepID=UPI002B67D4B5|nr:hypothetical protein [Actinospica sp.]HWG26100.1 hypothetical protein [Actinospica sp.]